MAAAKSRQPVYEFTARVERIARRGLYFALIPASVTRAIRRRGNVLVIATVNGVAEVRASLVPCGGGRHRLGLNASTRRTAGADEGGRVTIALAVDENPIVDPIPGDLALALREEDALTAFTRLPVGKQNHILQWIEKAAMERTRQRRIALAVEVALTRRERESDRGHTRARDAKLLSR